MESSSVIILGDIGGTNVRLRLVKNDHKIYEESYFTGA